MLGAEIFSLDMRRTRDIAEMGEARGDMRLLPHPEDAGEAIDVSLACRRIAAVAAVRASCIRRVSSARAADVGERDACGDGIPLGGLIPPPAALSPAPAAFPPAPAAFPPDIPREPPERGEDVGGKSARLRGLLALGGGTLVRASELNTLPTLTVG